MTTEAHTVFGETAASTGGRPVRNVLDEVAEWQHHRENLAEQEDHGRARPDDWAASDDQAVALLRELADAVTGSLATAVPDPAARTKPRRLWSPMPTRTRLSSCGSNSTGPGPVWPT